MTGEDRVLRGAEVTGRRRLWADVVVVGTGAGGAVAAKELAEAGLSVVMVEEGELLRPEDFTARPRDVAPRAYRDGSQTTTLGTPPIVLPLGRAVGGTTVLNSATCYRPPPALLDAWGLWSADELDPYLRRVERVLGVAQVTPELAGRNAAIMRRGADALGWSSEHLHRAARGCVGSGVCAFGCPAGAKQHTGTTYVPQAWDAGAITVTGAKATRVVVEHGAARGVEARTAGGGRLRVDAELTVVAAGTVHTPGLLRRSGVRHRALGRNLSVHPATAVWAEMDEVVDMPAGVPQAFAVDEWASDGLMIEGWTGPPDMLALSLPARGEELRRLMLGFRRIAQAGLMIRDTGRGRVHQLGGRAVPRYDLAERDADLLATGIGRAAQLLLAAGAKAVHVPIAGAGPVRTPAAAAALTATPRRLTLTAFHPLGTAAAGTVLDADLRVDGTRNLLVTDGSAVPGALGVNPQLTIMALASRAAFRATGRPAPDHEPVPASIGAAPSRS